MKPIAILAALGAFVSSGCTGCTKPIPLTLKSNSGSVWVGDEEVPATATVVLERGVLSLSISGTSDERRSDRLEWLRGTVPLGDLLVVDGSAVQERVVKEDEEGVLDIGYASDEATQPEPEKFVSPYSRVEAYFPSDYSLVVDAYDFLDLTIKADGLAEPVSQTVRFTGRAGVFCVMSPVEGGHTSTASTPESIREFEECARLRPFLMP